MEVHSDAAVRPLLLIADDDVVTCQYLSAAAATLGWAAETVSDGDAALARAGHEPCPRAAVFDLRMAGLGGAALARALRQRLPAARLIALSGELGPERRRALLAAGCDEAVQKPVPIAALAALLDGAVRASAAAPAPPPIDAASAHAIDDEMALEATGDLDIAVSLRRLLAQQLDGELAALSAGIDADDGTAIAAATHRLKSACRLCGALALLQTLSALDHATEATARRAALSDVQRAAERFRDRVLSSAPSPIHAA